MTNTYRVREFAALAGVTVRALHHYDRLGLLKAGRSAAGYRQYHLRDLERLEQIVALKFLGVPLRQVGALLRDEPRQLPAVLRAQRLALEEKRRHLDRAIGAIGAAERSLESGTPVGAQALRAVIEVIEMQQDPEFWRRYYSDGAWAKLADKRAQWTPELQAQASQAWSELFADVEAALDTDPQGPVAQALAKRWKALVEAFTGGDAEVSRGVGRAWADRGNWPAPAQRQSAQFGNPQVWEFIRKATASGR